MSNRLFKAVGSLALATGALSLAGCSSTTAPVAGSAPAQA